MNVKQFLRKNVKREQRDGNRKKRFGKYHRRLFPPTKGARTEIHRHRADKRGDDPIAVVIPRQDCTPVELREIGTHLRLWLETRPYAWEVIGLEDLEAGRQPSSPGYYMLPIHKHVPLEELRQRYPHDVWTAALMTVAGGFEVATIARELEVDLAPICDRLAKYGDPVSFDPMFL